MHMSDALISPIIGGSMYLLSGGSGAIGLKKLKGEEKPNLAIMGVMGAFVFSAQMLNFTIPMTGSSGHLTGGLLLAAALGPQVALIIMASILLIQGLFFGDGGLMAYGCNVFNMGVIPTLIVYGLMAKPLYNKYSSKINFNILIVLLAVLSAELGALSVVVQTILSGKTGLGFGAFTLLMCGIHLPIGIVEGLITAVVLSYLNKYAPFKCHLWLENSADTSSKKSKFKWTVGFLLVAALLGGVASHFASSYEDGLEWSTARTISSELNENATGVAAWFSQLQEKTAFLPDYGFKNAPDSLSGLGTSVSGLSGIALTFSITVLAGLLLKRRSSRLNETENNEEKVI